MPAGNWIVRGVLGAADVNEAVARVEAPSPAPLPRGA